MNSARLVVLALALAAGGVAAYLASGSDRKAPAPAPAASIETADVLVAKSDLPVGQSLTADDLQWQSWPASTVSNTFIRRNANPNAMADFTGAIVRSAIYAGEPMRESKVVKANGSGFMAAILPSGMRAVSTEISPETGAGGFILPNDRVDVILSIRDRGDNAKGKESVNSEIVLSNIRVLAIDQTIEEKNGQKVVVGKTATLELKPEQTETLARARQSGTLSLALRSIADANAPQQTDDDRRRRQDTINIVRYGVSTPTTTQK